MVTTGIVGSSTPIANGLAWGALLDKSDRVVVANYGDGASNIGAVHEALNWPRVEAAVISCARTICSLNTPPLKR